MPICTPCILQLCGWLMTVGGKTHGGGNELHGDTTDTQDICEFSMPTAKGPLNRARVRAHADFESGVGVQQPIEQRGLLDTAQFSLISGCGSGDRGGILTLSHTA